MKIKDVIHEVSLKAEQALMVANELTVLPLPGLPDQKVRGQTLLRHLPHFP
jgi:hypothetical protein